MRDIIEEFADELDQKVEKAYQKYRDWEDDKLTPEQARDLQKRLAPPKFKIRDSKPFEPYKKDLIDMVFNEPYVPTEKSEAFWSGFVILFCISPFIGLGIIILQTIFNVSV